MFYPGQRWVSDSEPELGLGTIIKVEGRTVSISFMLSGENRVYAVESAPLRRVRFNSGDVIEDKYCCKLTVSSVEEDGELLIYDCEGEKVPEVELSDALSVSSPGERLLAHQVDDQGSFDLRLEANCQRAKMRKNEVYGFQGGRIDLIPHQLYVASVVTARPVPRVLLADEVGLGKTIEACLIMHRLLVTGRISRVLILVPESLIHQWFVELYRRFNLWFHIFSEESYKCVDCDLESNPFNEHQLVIAGTDFLSNSGWKKHVTAADWDLLVVDEAHHLDWSVDNASSEYELVEQLSQSTDGLLLLTATPEQLGQESHFARLRLLDPERFYDYSVFCDEVMHYQGVAAEASEILEQDVLTTSDKERLRNLLDQHGTGRVMFRNTRSAISGFPKRKALLTELSLDSVAMEALIQEFLADTGNSPEPVKYQLAQCPRVLWLAEFLRKHSDQKVLLICKTRKKAEAIHTALQAHLSVKTTLFHEGLSLIKRDRNAAWFAEPEGARLLICSEIGSEGRNFQFAHHLVLFDLPLDPELLEQRIGRLDRIGQTETIKVHIPFIKNSPQSVLAAWFHSGLDSIEHSFEGGRRFEDMLQKVRSFAVRYAQSDQEMKCEFDALVAETVVMRKAIVVQLEQGRDKLLELNSHNPEVASKVVRKIEALDEDFAIDAFMASIFESYGIHAEEIARRTFLLSPEAMSGIEIPGMPSGGMTFTFDRKKALSREDIALVCWDHPMVSGMIDLLLGSPEGNSSFAVWPDDGRSLLLEMVWMLECVAPTEIHVDRFLPPTPVRVVVDHQYDDCSKDCTVGFFAEVLERGNPSRILDNESVVGKMIPEMMVHGKTFAHVEVDSIVKDAAEQVVKMYDLEINRMQALMEVNPSVNASDVELLVSQKAHLLQCVGVARLRLDAVRLIWKGDSLS